MASNNDNAGKGPAKPSSEPAKKPTAVIDLKPTEVGIEKPPQDQAKAAATVAAAAASAAASAAPRPSASPASDKPQAAQPPKSDAASVPPPKAASGGSGLRSAATHLVAGLAGGLLALLGAEQVLPR